MGGIHRNTKNIRTAGVPLAECVHYNLESLQAARAELDSTPYQAEHGSVHAPDTPHLPLEVRLVHHIVVHDPEPTHPRGRQVEQRRRPQPSRAHREDGASLEAPLAADPDLGEDQVPRVPPHLVVVELGEGLLAIRAPV